MHTQIAVTPASYDDIGSLLDSMEYQHDEIELTVSLKRLKRYDVIFINCGATAGKPEKGGGAKKQREGAFKATITEECANRIREYVEQGGIIYASDWALGFIAYAFPDYVKVVEYQHLMEAKGFPEAELQATVVDKGLEAQLGRKIHLSFDQPGWFVITPRDGAEVKTHIIASGKVSGKDSTTSKHNLAGKPLLVSFRHGKGEVLYTSFHNHAQVSKTEEKLLRYLILKPMLADISAEMADLAWVQKDEVQETVDTVSVGAASDWHSYRSTTTQPLKIMLNWKTQANLWLEVEGPGFSTRAEAEVPPVEIVVPEAFAGVWRWRVGAHQASLKNFPFVTYVGSPAQVEGIVAPQNSAEFPQVLQDIQTHPPVDASVLGRINILGPGDTSDDIDITIIE